MVMPEKKPPVVTQEDELPLEPPLRTPGKGHGFSFGGEIGKIIMISFIVTFVVLMGMSMVLKGGFFVNKADFTKNIADMVTATDQAKADLAKAKSDVTTAVQTIPNTVTAQVNTSVAQSTAQWNSQLSTMSDKVTSVVNTNQTNVNNISTLTVDVSTLKPKVTVLETQSLTTSANITSLASRISDLEAKVKTLESSQSQTVITANTTGALVAKSGNVTVYVQASQLSFVNPWIGIGSGLQSSQMYFSVAANQTSQTGFMMTIINGTGKPILNLGLQLGLRVMLPDFTFPLTLVNDPVSIGGFDTAWTRQSASKANPIYFVVGTTTWAFQVPTGTSQYQCYISSNFTGTGDTGQQIVLQPAIQILGISQ